jgi:hypothetical protein
MPFFYVPGNHDVTNPFMTKVWKEKFGRHYYHFVYKNVLFLILNSEDPPGKGGHVAEEQLAYVRKALDENKAVRWTVVALHKPLWAQANLETSGWLDVEKALAGRPYTVFAGHVHRYQKFVRQGMNYYQLATTGGGSKMRGVRHGEFDHVVWVTMKKDGPVLANVLLDGVYPEDMRRPETDEAGRPQVNRRPCHPVAGKVFFDGCPAPNAQVVFHLVNADGKRLTRSGDALVEADGAYVLSTYAAGDGAPVGEYHVTVTWRGPADEKGKPGPNLLPERYAKPETSGLRVKVKEGRNDFTFDLTK